MRRRRHRRVRKKILGVPERPRLCVFRSLKHTYCQVIDDTTGRTLASASTLSPELRDQLDGSRDCAAAARIGTRIAQVCLERGIKSVVFDRAGYSYHGRLKALADAARKGGLQL